MTVVPESYKLVVDGATPDGRTLKVYGGTDPARWMFQIDGVHATVVSYGMMRDGGTRTYRTDRGTVVFPHRIGNDDHTPRLDGKRVT